MVQKLETALILKLFPDPFFASSKTISAFIDKGLLLTKKMVAKTNGRT